MSSDIKFEDLMCPNG